jgi:DNA invertase Pin-like site-specific DNA recombinase
MTPPTTIPCAIYHRVSTIDQNPTAARPELHAAAAARGYDVVIDVEETGSGAMNDRPGLLTVLEAARRGRVRVVLVWALDRFGRSSLDLLSNIQQLDRAGCSFVSVSQPLELHPGGDPTSRLMFTLLSAVAQWERDMIASRTRDALRRLKAAGAVLGRRESIDAADAARLVELRDVDGATWGDIAGAIGCSSTAARRAYAKIKTGGVTR